MKDRFEDTYRSDGQVKRAIDKRTEVLTGKHGRLVLDTTSEFPTFQERAVALQAITADEAYTAAKNKIDKLQRQPSIKFHEKLVSAVKQCYIYGRSAIEIIWGTDEETGNPWPTALHVLNSKKLGKVECDPNTWEFLGVHYSDLMPDDDLLEANDLIYFTINDDHVTPHSMYYGLSMLEPVIDESETKRIIKQEDLKEAAKTLYAGVAFIRFLNEATSSSEMVNFANQITPGGWTVHKYDIETQVQKIADNLQQLLEICDFVNREELRDIGVPSFIGGYEQIANYANSQQVLLAFKEMEINTGRTWLSDIIEAQWLNRLFYPLINVPPEQQQDAEVKLNYEFEDITFETVLDKVNAIMPLFDRHLVSGEKVLKFVDMEDVVEEFKNLKEQQDMNNERRFQLKLEAMKMSNEKQSTFGEEAPDRQPYGPTTSVRAALYEKLAKKIDEL